MKNQPSVRVIFLCQEDAVTQARGPSTVKDYRAFLPIGTFDPCFLQNMATCIKLFAVEILLT